MTNEILAKAAMDALVELVACKDLKETYEARRNDDEAKAAYAQYKVRQPIAWATARAIIEQRPR